jgi:hypothetical protein
MRERAETMPDPSLLAKPGPPEDVVWVRRQTIRVMETVGSLTPRERSAVKDYLKTGKVDQKMPSAYQRACAKMRAAAGKVFK